MTYVDPTGAHVDIAPISVDQKNKTWTFSTDAVLPEDASASKMTALSTGSIFNYRGLFTLYGIAGNQQLVWIAENSKYHKQIQAVHDVSKYDFNCLAAFANADGDSELFLGAGDGLYYFSAADLSTGGTKSKPTLPVMISQDPAFVNIQELYITTNEMVISVWAATGANQIVYQQFDFDINPLTPAVTLLGGGAGGHFAALLHPLNGSQQLFVLDSSQAKKTVTLLEQSGVSRLWQTSPYIIPSTGTNYDFTSYTAHIKIAGSDGLPIGTDAGAKHYVQLSCDGIMNVTCNGNAYTINSTGSTVEVDSSGCVTVMIPTNDLASPCLFLGDVPGATETYFNGAPVKIDPARKVKDGLAKVSDGPSLQTQAGSALPTGTSNESLQHAGPAVSQLHGEANKLSNTASSPHELDTLLKAATADGSTSWDLWHMLEKGIVQVLEFELQTIERAGKDVLHFVATLSKETFRFALISAEYCFKAISWVLKNFLGIDLSALIKWLGFLFGWDDIMDTQVVVVGYLNKFIDLTIQQIPTWAQDADSLLSDIENQANAVFGKSLPKDTNDQQSSNRHVNTTANSDTTTSDAGASPGANWLNYNVQHGSVGQSVSPSDSNTLTVASGDDDPMTKTSKAWDDCLGSIAHILGDIASDVFNLFRGDFTVGGIKQKLQSMLQDVIHDAMEGLKNFVNAIALTTIDLLKLFKTAANAELTKIPLLSFLWKVIGRGETFSMLNLVGLLIAIPTTVVTKMVTKKAPSASPAYPKIQAILNPRVSKTRTSTKVSTLVSQLTKLVSYNRANLFRNPTSPSRLPISVTQPTPSASLSG